MIRPLLALALLSGTACTSLPPPPPRADRGEGPSGSLLAGEIELALAIAEHGLPSPTPELEALVRAARETSPDLRIDDLLRSGGPETAPPRVRPGDELEVRVVGRPEFSDTIRVERDGKIELLHVGAVQVSGRSPVEIADLLKEATRPFLREPKIRVRLVRRAERSVRVQGRVRAHADSERNVTTLSLPDERRLSVYELVSRVQGLERDAASEDLLLLRPSGSADLAPVVSNSGGEAGAAKPTGLDPSEASEPLPGQICFHFSYDELVRARLSGRDAWLLPGDELVVPRRSTAFALGKLRRPGPFPLQEGLTFAGLVLQAGGFLEDADRSGVVVLRDGEVLKADLKEEARSSDVVYAPEVKRVYAIGGGVARRGPIRLPPGGLSVIEAIADAGWFTFDADLDAVQILRTSAGRQHRIRVPVEALLDGDRNIADYRLEPGDTILVPELGW